jgi:NhaP-type Na+/H+ and K+/H+ antiporter
VENVTFLIIALLFILLGLISKKIKHSIITAPMVFVLIGLLFGSDIFGIIDINFDSKTIRIIAELTLVLVLFSDASRIQVKTLVKEHNIPLRLLTIGLPLTMVLVI